jgi:hypothetical protein
MNNTARWRSVDYVNSQNEALHLKKSTEKTGCALLSPVRSATMQNNLQSTRKLQISLQSHYVTNGHSESPVNKMLDKAECDKFTVSLSLSSVLVRKEGKEEQCLKGLDFTTTARP